MTESALTAESNRLTRSRLEVVVQAYGAREVPLSSTVRYLAEVLNVGDLTNPSNRVELVQQLSRTDDALGLHALAVFHRDGSHVAGDGGYLEGSAPIAQAAPGSKSGLVEVPEGRFLRLWVTPIGNGDHVLVAGLEVSDATAHELRGALGDSGEVVLLANGKVAGSSIVLTGEQVPGTKGTGESLPSDPVPVTLGGKSMLMVYRQLQPDAGSLAAGAIGVAVPDPVGGLTERLTLVRFLSSVLLTVVALLMGWFLFWTLTRPLVGLSRTATRIAHGDLRATFAAPRDNEVGRLAGALQKMTSELQGHARRLQESSKRLLVAQQEERQRVARDLHDGMQQQLVVLAVKIKQLAASKEPPNPLILEHLAAEAEEAAFALQDLGRGIFPTVLGDQGVAAALRTSASRLPMKVRLEVGPEMEDRRLSPEIEGTLYFVAMEGMANAQKHAPESELTISLRSDDSGVVLEVGDDGPGFDQAEESQGAGLQNMADRVNAVGGVATIRSTPGSGVYVVARIPLGPDSPAPN